MGWVFQGFVEEVGAVAEDEVVVAAHGGALLGGVALYVEVVQELGLAADGGLYVAEGEPSVGVGEEVGGVGVACVGDGGGEFQEGFGVGVVVYGVGFQAGGGGAEVGDGAGDFGADLGLEEVGDGYGGEDGEDDYDDDEFYEGESVVGVMGVAVLEAVVWSVVVLGGWRCVHGAPSCFGVGVCGCVFLLQVGLTFFVEVFIGERIMRLSYAGF